jgi:hypothetical protein
MAHEVRSEDLSGRLSRRDWHQDRHNIHFSARDKAADAAAALACFIAAQSHGSHRAPSFGRTYSSHSHCMHRPYDTPRYSLGASAGVEDSTAAAGAVERVELLLPALNSLRTTAST